MSGSLTVIGGHSNTQALTGLVTTPSGFTGGSDFVIGLQSVFSAISGLVSTGGANFENINVASLSGGQTVTPTVGGIPGGFGVLDISNQDSINGTTPGSTSVSLTVPLGYDVLDVEAPGSETISGNGTSNFLGVFGANSSVTFSTGTGSGLIAAAGNDHINLGGSTWSVNGGVEANVNIVTDAASVFVTLAGGTGNASSTGYSNAIGSYSPDLNVLSTGTNDFIVTGAGNTPGTNNVTVTGFANVQDLGANDTVLATGTGAASVAFGFLGGKIDFINQSTSASQVLAGINTVSGLITSPGSVTAFGGAGGGVYDGGVAGNNSLVGGSGLVTLYGAGVTNYLYADGAGSAGNYLNAAAGSSDTLIGGTGTTNNTFVTGVGTDVVSTNGSGNQVFFVGTQGSETLTGSTVSGATNAYIFNQAASQGGGTDIITNFKVGVSHGYINLTDSVTGVTISGYGSISGGAQTGSVITLSDGTNIKLLGVSASSLNASIIGGTSF